MGRRALVVVGATPERERARAFGELFGGARLPDTSLAGQERDVTVSGHRIMEESVQDGQLIESTDERTPSGMSVHAIGPRRAIATAAVCTLTSKSS